MIRRTPPLRDGLREPRSSAEFERMWSAIDRRWTAHSSSRARSSRLGWAAAAMVGLLALSLAAGSLRRHAATSPLAAPIAPSLLTLEDGRALGNLPIPESATSVVRLSDGSHIDVQPHTELVPLLNATDAVTWLLSKGRVTVDVKPGGPRRWSIECGLATVEVVGTRFQVDRDRDGVRIAVDHGVVLVRGERVPERVQRLTAGERLVLREAPALPPPTPDARAAGDRQVGADLSVASRPRATARDALAARANALAASTPSGSAEQRVAYGHASDLLQRSDDARSAGRPHDAATLLAELIRDYPGDDRAGTVAFTLGKIRLDALGDAQGATAAFADAIRFGLPSELLEDAYARVVEARARAGDVDGAREATAVYDAKFPGGTRRDAITRWLAGR